MYGNDAANYLIGGIIVLALFVSAAVFVGRATGFVHVDYRCHEGVKQERWVVGSVPTSAWDKVGDNFVVKCDD